MQQQTCPELDVVFYPRSIAVVGASSHMAKSGAKWVIGLQKAGFPGRIYPVSARGGSLAGLDIHPSLSSIDEDVDYVIASVPAQSAMSVVEECVRKKVKAVQFFTAGFRETGTVKAAALEEEMLRRASTAGLRIIGPNCIGACCPKSRIPLGPSPLGKVGAPGNVSFISQSGGIAAKLVEYGIARHLHYSKGVSIGNSIDLDAADFLEYFAGDDTTWYIGMYMEGTNNGRRFFDALRTVAAQKPTVVLKGGRTEAGAATARSHTGSLASSAPVWSAMLRQSRAIEAMNLEELTDCLLLLQKIGATRARGIGIVGGLADGGGGISVSGSDACADNGLDIPELRSTTAAGLRELIGEVGSILRNPVDVSPAQFRGLDVLFESIKRVASDPGVELLIVQEDVDIMLSYLGDSETDSINDFLSTLPDVCRKPLVMVMPPGSCEAKRLVSVGRLQEARIPVFPTMSRAARAISLVSHRPNSFTSTPPLQ